VISGDVARKSVDAARQTVLAPWQFGRAAVRSRGPQRQLLLDAVKAAVATVLAWVLAAQVLHTALPWLAPYTAVFIIGTTVHQSVRSAVRQVAVVALGVLLAAAVAFAISGRLIDLALAVVVGTMLGRWRPLQPDGSWVALTALLMLTYSTPLSEDTLLSRVFAVALGAAVGVAVNAVILPPIRLNSALSELAARGNDVADLLTEAADRIEHGVGEQALGSWQHRVWQLQHAFGAEDALADGRESLRGNPRRRSHRTGGSADAYSAAATALDNIVMQLSTITTAVAEQSSELHDQNTNTELRETLAELLRAVAEAVRILGDYPAAPADGPIADAGREAVQRAEELHARAQQHRDANPAPSSGGWTIGALLMSSRRVVDIVSGVQNQAGELSG